ncbi:MAG: transcription-repair coupling factor [Nitrospiraceae bacterium]|nr:transcription-repair coupling factor [Nitrospiraceae bacterium]
MNLLKIFNEFGSALASAGPGERIHSLRGSAPALFLSLLELENGAKERRPFIAAAESEEEALKLVKDIDFFLSVLHGKKENVYFLPEPDGPDISGKRARFSLSLGQPAGKKPSVIASKPSLSAPLWKAAEVRKESVSLSYPGEFPRQELEQRVLRLGYKHVPLVTLPGQFRLKGWILDIFPAGAEDPVRVEFFGDDVDTMRLFDVETQMHTRDVSSVLVLPAAEPEEGEAPDLSGFFNSIFALESGEGLPDGAVTLTRHPIKGEGMDAGVMGLSGLGVLHSERRDITELPLAVKRLRSMGGILFVLSSGSQAERIKNILWEEGLHVPILKPEDVLSYEGGICITTGSLSAGVHLPGFFLITDKELFGAKPAWKPMRKSKMSGLLQNIDDLSAGDYIVHSDHGIGKFAGFIRQSTDGYATDMLVIEYAKGDRIYLPFYGIEKIHKYKTPEGASPELDRLGGKVWERKKAKVKRRLKEMAGQLVKIYAGREISKGFAFSPDTELHREFDSFFPYEETPDQLRSIGEVKKDMESPRPMERLLCGDVGYGKTEVAMRAAFKAAYDAKQVVVLVPTTLLCEQHFRTFTQRFSAFPVKIDYISRFKSRAEKTAALEAFEKGETDILIGTHALLKTGLSFRNLGLLIIDEEHRFGVAHKERIKELRKNVDVLLLTATPIPRTLQMALSGIRDMSVIESPPEERLAVKSTVAVFQKQLIKEAIEKELSRGGQVFLVHNRIEDIHKILELLNGLLPSARLGMAHGRMGEKQLEDTMIRFMDGALDVLVSTAIIGAGLDIPNANTIIVDRADMMGLADLYQLRGRVGRGSIRAYALFLIPGHDIITDDAKKRLQALEELSYLGAGFRVAMKDLEIRGAGNLLGAEQSGYIADLGFDMYLELLEKAVAELRGEEVKEKTMPLVELKVDALIPETYIEDVSLRLSVYRRIAGSGAAGDLERISDEMEERFGPLPDEVKNLLQIMDLRIASEKSQVERITQFDGMARFHLRQGASVPVEKLLAEFQGRLKFSPDGFFFDVLVSERKVLRDISSVLAHLTA